MFTNLRSGFDAFTGYLMARASESAYLIHEQRVSMFNRFGFDHVHSLSEFGAEAVVASHNGQSIVAFRGTDSTSAIDWATNSRIGKTDGPFNSGDRVHAGFLSYCDTLFDQILTEVGSNEIFLTGHSLGAAAATVAAARFAVAQNVPMSVWLFGSPRVGDRRFAQLYNATCPETYRVVNSCDVVTRVPYVFGTYRHIGNLEFFNRSGHLLHGPSSLSVFWQRWQGFTNGLFRWVTDGIRDHLVDRYVVRMVGVRS